MTKTAPFKVGETVLCAWHAGSDCTVDCPTDACWTGTIVNIRRHSGYESGWAVSVVGAAHGETGPLDSAWIRKSPVVAQDACGKRAMERPGTPHGRRWKPCRRAAGHSGACAHEPSDPVVSVESMTAEESARAIDALRAVVAAQREKIASAEKAAFKRGAEAAAGIAASYDYLSTHSHRVSDCVLSKLNLRDAKPRKNRRKAVTK